MGKKPRALTPAKRRKVVKAVSLGLTRAQQAAYAGISLRTLHRYIAKGREEKGVWSDWVDEMEEAEAQAVARNVALIMKAAHSGTWQAAAWWLERKYPQEYARRTFTDNKTEMSATVKMSDSECEAWLLKYGGGSDGGASGE